MNHTQIAAAIVAGAALVAASIIYTHSPSTQVSQAIADTPTSTMDLTNVTRSGEARNIYGDNEAPVTIVEFSDFECPFCARLHPTLKRIVDESGGGINWEFRHLPLPSHPNAQIAAEASECVAKYGGKTAFWDFTDTLFSTMQHSEASYRAIALNLSSVDINGYDTCLATGETRQLVQDDLAAAQRLGGRGTPFSVIVRADGKTIPVPGALPYDAWMNLLQ